MLVPYSDKYKQGLTNAVISVYRKEEYKWYFTPGYPYLPRFIAASPDNQCFGKFYVSVDQNDNIIGFICYDTNNTGEIGSNLGIMKFKSDFVSNFIFAEDLRTVIVDFFEVYHGDSLRFKGVIGNPAVRHYTRIVNAVGGTRVGRLTRSVKLYDGKFYDEVLFQITKEKYWSYREKCKKNHKEEV